MNPFDQADEEAVAAERARRVALVLRAEEPSRAEVLAAHARFVSRRRRARTVRAVPFALGFVSLLLSAFALAAGVRFVATHDILRVLAPSLATPAVDVPAPRTRGAARRLRTGNPAMPPAADDDVAVEPELSPSAESALPPVPVVEVPAVVPAPSAAVVPPPTRTPASGRTSHAPTPPPPAPSAAPQTGDVVEVVSPWTVAAKAMRAGDYVAAERAFGQLANGSDPQQRDEARLARAQVWLAQGRASDARPELEALSASGATPLVRQRAQDELLKISGSSIPRPAGTNSP
jgi:hypothetical protein